eukprot:5999946-Amphidinium_carterae.1
MLGMGRDHFPQITNWDSQLHHISSSSMEETSEVEMIRRSFLEKHMPLLLELAQAVDSLCQTVTLN